MERRCDEVSELLSKMKARDTKYASTKVKLIRAQGECLGIKSR